MLQKVRTLIAHVNPKSPISEQYRTVRTNIQFASVDQDIRKIVVTSPSPFEGKSMTAANLATVFAQQGKNVLLVDADLRKPTMHYTFGKSNTNGLSKLLLGHTSLQEAVSRFDIENLSILTSGPVPPNPSELLGSNAMSDFMKQAEEQYDLVIFDTPPVLAVTDSQILANACDGVLLVVRSKQTERESAMRAKELLMNARAKLLGVVLNGKKDERKKDYYYYGEE